MSICSETLELFEGFAEKYSDTSCNFAKRTTKMIKTADGSIAKVIARRDEEYDEGYVDEWGYQKGPVHLSKKGSDINGGRACDDKGAHGWRGGLVKNFGPRTLIDYAVSGYKQPYSSVRDKDGKEKRDDPEQGSHFFSDYPGRRAAAHAGATVRMAGKGIKNAVGAVKRFGQGAKEVMGAHSRMAQMAESDYLQDRANAMKGGFKLGRIPGTRKLAATKKMAHGTMAVGSKDDTGDGYHHSYWERGVSDYDIENMHQDIPRGQKVRRLDPAALDALNRGHRQNEWVEASASGKEARTGLIAHKQAYKKRAGSFGFDPRAAMKANIQGRARENYSGAIPYE